jgi:hypothetical protein
LPVSYARRAQHERKQARNRAAGSIDHRSFNGYIMTDDIKADEFVIQPPWTGTDPRNDTNILKVLTGAGKLVP